MTLPGSSSKIKYSSLPASVSPQRKASAPGRRVNSQGEFRKSSPPRATDPMQSISPGDRSWGGSKVEIHGVVVGLTLREGGLSSPSSSPGRGGLLTEKVHLPVPRPSHSSLGTSNWFSSRLVHETEAQNWAAPSGLPPLEANSHSLPEPTSRAGARSSST